MADLSTLLSSPEPLDTPDPTLPIVLTPGYMDDARKLAWMASYLRRMGLQPVIISPQPSDATVGIDQLAMRLADEIEHQLGPHQRFDFFGFSMGGLIGRYYLQRLGGATRIRRLVTVATPHRGSWTVRFLPTRPALAQMCPGSDFLNDLNGDALALAQHAFVALWTPFDLSVTPAHHCYLPPLPALRLFSPFHATLLHDPIVLREVARLFLPGATALTAPANTTVATR
jgi:triacylglycerol lipase